MRLQEDGQTSLTAVSHRCLSTEIPQGLLKIPVMKSVEKTLASVARRAGLTQADTNMFL